MTTWPSVPLGDVLTPVRREINVNPIDTYGLLGVRLDGRGPFLREEKQGSQISAKKLFQVKSGDFIYSRLFAWRGAFGIISNTLDDRFVSSEFPTFIPDRENVDGRFLKYWFRLPRVLHRVEADCTGSTPQTRNRFKEKFFLKLEIPLPPLDEQRKIVAKVERMAGKVEEARRLRDQIEREMKALSALSLSSMLAGTLTPLGDVCVQITDGEHNTPTRVPLPVVPLATAKNVRDGHLDLTTTDFVSEETASRCWRRCKPTDGDVLMVCVGATTGRVCRLVEPPDMVLVRSVALLRPDQTKLLPDYLEYALKSSDLQIQIWDRVKQAAQPCLYLNQMKMLEVPLPDLDTQRGIVRRIRSTEVALATIRKSQTGIQKKLDALLPSILDTAFKGEL